MDQNTSNTLRIYDYPGIAQEGRIDGALLPDFAHIDERNKADLLDFASRYADLIAYYNLRETLPSGSWKRFFEKDLSVFLATIIKTDTQHFLSEQEEVLFSIRHQQSPRQKLRHLKAFFELIFSMAQLIGTWTQKARRLNDSLDGSPKGVELTLENLIASRLRDDLKRTMAIYESFRIQKGVQSRGGIDPEVREKAYHDYQAKLKTLAIELSNSKALKAQKRSTEDQFLEIESSTKKLQLIFQSFYTGIFQVIASAEQYLEISLKEKSNHPPDVGLFLAFTDLFSYLQQDLNTLTKKHLDYYYKQILGQRPKDSNPDEVNLHFELASQVDSYYLESGTLLNAGKSIGDIESFYEICEDVMLNQAQISEVKTIFVSQSPLLGTESSYRLVSNIFAAPVANSKDGLGTPLEAQESWPTFGEDPLTSETGEYQMDFADIGMAVSSSALLLAEGEREILIRLAFTQESFVTLTTLISNISRNSSISEGNAFYLQFFNNLEIYASGEEDWFQIKNYHVNPIINATPREIQISLTLQASDPALVPYHSDLPGAPFDTQWPVIQVKLSNTDTVFGYSFLRNLILEQVIIEVGVKKLRQLDLFNEIGKLDNTKPFQPFGPTPAKGSYLLIGNKEIFKKELTHLELEAEWYDLPLHEEGLNGYYAPYELDIKNEDFKVNFSALKRGSFFPEEKEARPAFPLFTSHKDPKPEEEEVIEEVPPFLQAPRPKKDELDQVVTPGENRLKGHTQFQNIDLKALDIRPDYDLESTEYYDPAILSGFFRMELASPKFGFAHKEFPSIFTKVVTENSVNGGLRHLNPFKTYRKKPIPEPPLAPVLNTLTVNYKAEARINLLKVDEDGKINDSGGRLFHIDPFGVRTVHKPGNTNSRHLLPQLEADGYLFLGLQNIKAPQALSLFFQMKESRSVKVLSESAEIDWHYLSNDTWRKFDVEDFISDSTNGFTTSGIIHLNIPRDISDQNTIMPEGTHWIRISASGNTEVLGKTISLKTQAAKARWVDNSDIHHLHAPLPPLTINRLDTAVSEISEIFQPYPSFGGNPAEKDERYYTRVSERLRHKNRAVTPWDIERMILEAFPLLHQAKCLNHSAYPNWVPDPGTLEIVVVPHASTFEHHVEPKVSYSDLQKVKEFIEAHTSTFAKVKVRNPSYERVKVMCNVVLEKGKNNGEYLNKLSREVNNFLVPWRKDASHGLNLGGSISKDAVLRFMESLPFVDFITGFSLVQVMENEGEEKLKEEGQYKIYDTVRDSANLPTVQASSPWSVLIPIPQHAVHFIYEQAYKNPSPAGVNNMSIGTDFVISMETELDFTFDEFKHNLIQAKSEQDAEAFSLTIELPQE